MLAAIFDAAKIGGWRAVHFRPARTKYGWVTPYTGDDGFPDTVLVRPPELLFVELKAKYPKRPGSRVGEPRPEQIAWLDDLQACDVEAFVIQPPDLDDFLARLIRPRTKVAR